MPSRSSQVKLALIIIISILVFFLVFLGNSALVKSTQNGFDILTHWKGAQLLIKENQDPYTSATTFSLNQFLTTLGKPEETKPYRFENPLFALIFYAPLLIFKNPETVRIVWMTINVFIVGVIGYSMYKSMNIRKPIWLISVLAIYLVFGFTSFWPILTGSLSIISLLFLILAVTAISRSNNQLAGVFIAFSLVDLKFAGVTVLFLVIWALLHRNSQFLGWFFTALLFLIGFSMLFLPIWPIHYVVSQFTGFIDSIRATSDGNALSGNPQFLNRLLWVKAGVLILILIFEWFFSKQRGEKRLIWLTFLTLPVALLMTREIHAENAIAALPAIFMASKVVYERRPERTSPIVMLIIAGLFIVSWFISGFLLPGLGSFTPELSSVVCALAAILLLYWIRWWIANPSIYLD